MKRKPLLRQAFKAFFKNWGAYTILVVVINSLILGVVVPLTTFSTSLILRMNGVPYLSYTNVGWLLTQRPVAVIELFILLFVILALVFWQFAFLLFGIQNIGEKQNQRLPQIALMAFKNIGHLRVGSFLFFVIYFVLILPISDIYLNSPLLSKVQVPVFIFEAVDKSWLYIALVAFAYLLLFYLGIRLIQVLPLMILNQQPGFTAARKSWQMTRHNSWRYIWRIVVLGAVSVLTTTLFSGLLYQVQLYFDQKSNGVAFTGAVINMGLLSIWQYIIGAFSLVVFMLVLIFNLDDRRSAQTAMSPNQLRRHPYRRRIIASLLVLFYLGVQVAFNAVYLQGALLTRPLTISHRGVDNGNGVQNTIPALNKTSHEKPDYVEMDIHETKDHQFVVMHDEDLEDLANVDKAPHQLTLKQLTKLKVHENGHTAHIAGFNAYLTAAERDHQKLLVEIKTTKYDSSNMLQLFIKRYEKRLLRDHDRIHSLDYQVISGLKKRAPKLFVSYILPFNFSFPETKANAYTMEETTLNQNFVDEAHARKQQVFAWTVDDDDDMTRMMFLNVDGIITDNLHELQVNIETQFDHPSYAQRLLIYSNELQDVSDSGGMPEN